RGRPVHGAPFRPRLGRVAPRPRPHPHLREEAAMRHEYFTAAFWAAILTTRIVLRRLLVHEPATAEPVAPEITPVMSEPAERRARLDERTLLNLPDFDGGAFIRTYVEDTSERELLRHSTCNETPCTHGAWNFEPRMKLEIADCRRVIALEFQVGSAEGRRNSLHKLDMLDISLQLFREAMVAEFEPYDRRARELEQLTRAPEP